MLRQSETGHACIAKSLSRRAIIHNRHAIFMLSEAGDRVGLRLLKPEAVRWLQRAPRQGRFSCAALSCELIAREAVRRLGQHGPAAGRVRGAGRGGAAGLGEPESAGGAGSGGDGGGEHGDGGAALRACQCAAEHRGDPRG